MYNFITHLSVRKFILASIFLLFPVSGISETTNWPAKPIHVITPFPAGGINDLIIRTVAEFMANDLGQNIIIEQKTGAGGNIGTSFVARSEADGYTWLASSFPVFSMAPVLYDDAPFDPIKDFDGVAKLATVPNVLVVDPSLNINTVEELVTYGQSNPDALFYGSPAKGSSANVGTEELKRIAKFDATQVLYKGASAALVDVAGGRIQFTQTSVSLALPQIKAGNLKALAVVSEKSSPLLPDVPVLGNSAYREAIVEPWYGIHVPAGTPKEIIKKINDAALKAVQRAEVRERIASFGGTVAQSLSPEEVDTQTKQEVMRWQALAKDVDFR